MWQLLGMALLGWAEPSDFGFAETLAKAWLKLKSKIKKKD